MDKLVVRGGSVLSGEVRVEGSKNGALPILFASMLAEEPVVLNRVPELLDIRTGLRLLAEFGAESRVEKNRVTIETPDEGSCVASYDMVRRMRASVCALGPIIARRGTAKVSRPGGCAIGDRPIDLHLKGLAALGAEIKTKHGYIEASAKNGLRGATIFLSGPYGSTVLGTANIMMAASRAKGLTTIEGAACEPEISALAGFLRTLGVPVEGDGTPQIRIEGVDRIGGGEFTIPPDRIEAGTYAIAGAIAGGSVKVTDCEPKHLYALLDVFERMEVPFEAGATTLEVRGVPKPRPVDFATLPYPGVPTDLQAQLMALMCRADGISIVTEKVYPDRFMHIAELNRLGARVRKEGNVAVVHGGHPLSGADVMASDLRASACLVLAGLVADGDTEVHRIYHLDRGYVRMESKLRALGADVSREYDEAGV